MDGDWVQATLEVLRTAEAIDDEAYHRATEVNKRMRGTALQTGINQLQKKREARYESDRRT